MPFVPVVTETLAAVELPAACGEPDKKTLDGCALVVQGEIWIASDLTAERRAVARSHELGHVFSFWFSGVERVRHIPATAPECDESVGAALMCGKPGTSPQPTADDFDFVLGVSDGS